MRKRRAGLKCAPSPKICGSGWKRTRVPRRLRTRPMSSSFVTGTPRSKALAVELLAARDLDFEPRPTSALTTEMPTPCRPPDVW